MDSDEPNREQAIYWDEQAGPRWVAAERHMDAQLEPLGVAAMDALGLAPGERVLDVGCGAGATSLAIAERVRPGEVVGLDISGSLLARARERAAGIDSVRFERGDAQTFAFEGRTFDAIFSRFGVMFFADPVAAFANLRTALRPGGRLGFVCWRPMRENPLFHVPIEAAMPLLPQAPAAPPPDAPGPFAFADAARVRAILERAGYHDVAVTPHDGVVAGERTDLDGAVDLAMQFGPLSRALSGVDDATRARIRERVRAAFVPYHGASGVSFPAATWLVTARA